MHYISKDKFYILRIVLHVIDVLMYDFSIIKLIRDGTMTLHGTIYISVVLDDYVAHASV